jgi:hypothetical protein
MGELIDIYQELNLSFNYRSIINFTVARMMLIFVEEID